MQKVLKEKLWAYIVHNHPDLLFELQENDTVKAYLDEKVNSVLPLARQNLPAGSPAGVMEDYCLNAMVEPLGPSRYSYIRSVLEVEFPKDYQRLDRAGTLVYQVLSMLKESRQLFEDFEFKDHQHQVPGLRNAVIVCIHDYLI